MITKITDIGGFQEINIPDGRDFQNKQARLDLLYEVSKKVGSVTQLRRLVEQIIQMTQHTLNAAASSVLVLGEKDQELFFETAAGPASNVLRQVKLNSRSGIAGWVASHGKPIIVNDVSNDSRFDKTVDLTTGFTTRSILCVPLTVQRKVVGVIEVLNKLDASNFTEQDMEALTSVASIAAMAIENTRLHQAVLDAYKSTIKALAAAIDAKDPYTHGHSQRVMEYAILGGISLSLPEEEMENLEYAAILHDIGKIIIDDRVLKKPDSLTPQEWDIMHEHPVTGSVMLKGIPFLEKASGLVLHHHERYDGSGYPDRLKGDNIPLGARLIAVADAFDTMTSDRAYRPALTVAYTLSEILGCVGTQFCPIAVRAFVSSYQQHSGQGQTNNPPLLK